MKKKALIVVFDMLAGHWDKSIVVPSTGLQPPNVMGYVKAGKLPAFRECIEQGVFVYSWNNGNCNTPYGQKYLASGTYKVKAEAMNGSFCQLTEGMDRKTILNACKEQYPAGKVASFGSDAWMQSGWWKAPDATYGFGGYFSDFLTTQYCFKWMTENPDWKMTLLYLAQYDLTGNCPVYKKDVFYTEDKHHSLLYLDKILWMIIELLKESGWWNETLLFIASDHGCHYGCETAVEEGRSRGIPEKSLSNYCSNHQPPYDCRQWDFKNNTVTNKKSNCCRRTTFMINGGALPQDLRKKSISYGEIIDFSPTIAKLMGINFSSDGTSLV
ncbi:MAG: sulfatase-like hydrolase/transferase [Candidatus Omnitrophica bacterium]|nr:sulfatase-like hydrolase/transferase [Candidatus Omnitrophota bacterium]